MSVYGLKFVMIGDSRVGKSQLSRRLMQKPFNDESQSTIKMEFATHKFDFEKCVIKAQIWDTAGQERFESMTKYYFRDAVGAALVYDVTSLQSFHNARQIWLRQVKEFGSESMKIVLVGNKLDLVESGRKAREVPLDDVRDFAERENLDWIEVSALSGFGVNAMFRRLVLSVAKLLPDVRANLDLADLPEGWIVVLPTMDSPSSSGATSRQVNASPTATPYMDAIMKKPPRRQISDESNAATTMEDLSPSSTGNRFNSSSTPSPSASVLALQKTTSFSSLEGSGHGTPLSLNRRLSSAERAPRVLYLNYWTGESQDIEPDGPAELPEFLFTSVVAVRKKRLQNTDSTRTVATMRETNEDLPGDAADADDILFDDGPSVNPMASTRTRSFASMDESLMIADRDSNTRMLEKSRQRDGRPSRCACTIM